MSTLYDQMTREPLFEQGQEYTLRQFIKIARNQQKVRKPTKVTTTSVKVLN